MEEILASIRRIISEDEDEARAPQSPPVQQAATRPRAVQSQPVQAQPVQISPAAVQTTPRPNPASQPPAVPPEPQLVARPAPEQPRAPQPVPSRPQPVAQPAAKAAPTPPPAQPAPYQQVTMSQPDPSEQILSETAVAAASRAFQSLSQKVKVSTKGDGRSLEDIVAEMLRPMIKDWLDAHLPAIVEQKVEAEVKRLARQGS